MLSVSVFLFWEEESVETCRSTDGRVPRGFMLYGRWGRGLVLPPVSVWFSSACLLPVCSAEPFLTLDAVNFVQPPLLCSSTCHIGQSGRNGELVYGP